MRLLPKGSVLGMDAHRRMCLQSPDGAQELSEQFSKHLEVQAGHKHSTQTNQASELPPAEVNTSKHDQHVQKQP